MLTRSHIIEICIFILFCLYLHVGERMAKYTSFFYAVKVQLRWGHSAAEWRRKVKLGG